MCKKDTVISCKECEQNVIRALTDSNLKKFALDLKSVNTREEAKNILMQIKNILKEHNYYSIEYLKDRCSYFISFLNEASSDTLWSYETMNLKAFVSDIMKVFE